MLFMTNGYSQDIYGSKLTLAGDHTLTDQEKCLVVSINMTAASKTVILGVADGDAMTVINIGSNAFTVKNIADDTGTSLDANGMVTVIGGGDTADAAKFITGGGGGGGGGSSGTLLINVTGDYTDPDNPVYSADKTTEDIAAAIEAGESVIAKFGAYLVPLTSYTENDGVYAGFVGWQDYGFDLENSAIYASYVNILIERNEGDPSDSVSFEYVPVAFTATSAE